MTEGGATPAARVAFAYRLATGRHPSDTDLNVLLKNLQWFREQYQADREAALKLLSQGEHPRREQLDVADLATHTMVASLIFNLDAVITKQ